MTETHEQRRRRYAYNRRIAKRDSVQSQVALAILSDPRSLAALSRDSGVSVATISKYSKLYTARPSYPTLRGVAKSLGYMITLTNGRGK
jgi:transcriptional regulator with XRE-family HTH domain